MGIEADARAQLGVLDGRLVDAEAPAAQGGGDGRVVHADQRVAGVEEHGARRGMRA
jgi:hypothetical protein